MEIEENGWKFEEMARKSAEMRGNPRKWLEIRGNGVRKMAWKSGEMLGNPGKWQEIRGNGRTSGEMALKSRKWHGNPGKWPGHPGKSPGNLAKWLDI